MLIFSRCSKGKVSELPSLLVPRSFSCILINIRGVGEPYDRLHMLWDDPIRILELLRVVRKLIYASRNHFRSSEVAPED